jgi:hypothetical protein
MSSADLGAVDTSAAAEMYLPPLAGELTFFA